MIETVNPERVRYERLWGAVPDYRRDAPGTSHVQTFLDKARPHAGASVVDFGCGTGRAARDISLLAEDVQVTMLDFAANCLDPEIAAVVNDPLKAQLLKLRFQVADLTQPIDLPACADFGYCTDVMEHVAPGDVEAVLRNVLVSARRVFFVISTVPDHFGEVLDGAPLHLTVQPHEWWAEKFKALGARIDWDNDLGDASAFWVSIYANGDDFSEVTGLNASDERIRSNIMTNLRRGLQEVCPHEPQTQTICLLAGGPSLADHEAEIIERGRAGELFVTVNGTYKWLLDRGIKPAAQIMLDAREFNARFIDPVVDTCKYIFSSQTAPEAVAKVPDHQAWLFHSGENEIMRACIEEYSREQGADRSWYPVIGGSTVIGRGLVVLAILGFRNIEVFGWDSCLRDGQHHAYPQAENDSQHVVDISLGGRTFKCHPWMVVQANEVPKIIRHVLGKIEGFNLEVRGDGLIAHMLKYAAEQGAKHA